MGGEEDFAPREHKTGLKELHGSLRLVWFDKITLIENFLRPQTVCGVRSFYGLANYYRRAIASFVEIASPLSKLLKKLDTSISPIWNKACEEVFLTLK